jgi:hypothetical protein
LILGAGHVLYKGKKISGPNVEYIIIPRSDEDIVFVAQAVLDMSEFDSLCPAPKPPPMMRKGGVKVPDDRDPRYLTAMNDHGTKRFNYMALKSLQATEDLEWENVNFSDPDTWSGWIDELKEAGFSDIEINRITIGVMNANCLNEARLDEARSRFLSGQGVEANGSSSHEGEPRIMQSGEPANA